MSTWKNINGIVVGVVICSLLFLSAQYFMAYENGETLLEDKAYDSQVKEEQIENLTKTDAIDEYVRFVRTNEPGNVRDYTLAAYNHLTEALEELAGPQEAILAPTKVTELQEQFLGYQNTAAQRPNELKSLLITTTNTIQSIEHRSDLENELNKLQEETQAFDVHSPEEDRLAQEEEYFKQIATVLEEVESVM